MDETRTDNAKRSSKRAKSSSPIASHDTRNKEVNPDDDMDRDSPSEILTGDGQGNRSSRHSKVVEDQEHVIEKVTDHGYTHDNDLVLKLR